MSRVPVLSATDASAIAAVLATAAAAMADPAGEPGNGFFSGDALAGTPDGASLAADLEDRLCVFGSGYGSSGAGCPGPDTYLGVLDDAGAIVATDDDGGWVGNGLDSAIFNHPIEPSLLVRWLVTGFGVLDFDGRVDGPGQPPHGQIGQWHAFAYFYDAAGRYVAYQAGPVLEFVTGDEVFAGSFTAPPQAAGGTSILGLSNIFTACECAADVDVLTVSGLEPGAEYEVRVTEAEFDTVLATFDDAGVQTGFNDDDPAGGSLSRLTADADGQGRLTFAVSGAPDSAFTGFHDKTGLYQVTIGRDSPGCSPADLAPPLGLLDLADLNSFVIAFVGLDPRVDYDGNGLLDPADVGVFVSAFAAGCR